MKHKEEVPFSGVLRPFEMGNVNMYMPIKALNTFSRDWKIQARVASKTEKRQTKSGGSLLKIELVDMYGT